MLATSFGLSGLSLVDHFASGCRRIINDRRKWDMKFEKDEWLSSWNDAGHHLSSPVTLEVRQK